MKIFYFADLLGDVEEEAKQIEKTLYSFGVNNFDKIEIFETPKFFDNKHFDVLFFDWGGMSIGNSLLEHFCDYILKNALEHPSRIYVMNSTFTSAAMDDAMVSFPDMKNINNVFLNVEDAIPYLKSLRKL